MNRFSNKFTIQQILELTRQFPKEIKLQLMKEWMKEFNNSSKKSSLPELSIEGYNDPTNLDKAAFSESMFQSLEELWKDEVSAEELVLVLS